MLTVSHFAKCSKAGHLFNRMTQAYGCPHKVVGAYDCGSCGSPMREVADPITGQKNGYLWRCDCMPEDLVLTVG
jgi:hypothetical protein